MKLCKPTWVHHDDKPIFAIDVHPEGRKFATGGQGNDSGRVVIWNLLPVLSEDAELDSSIPKVLCQMDNHLGCVNCVRWSQNGQMLASGSDDKLVMVWKLSKNTSSGIFGGGNLTKCVESWKCISTLRGHSGDVLDLAWSPQDRWLASCSIDNTVIIWNIHSLPMMIAVLKGHTGLVKGVTWDPVGKFLATQSDDRTVKIWKTSDWTCGNTITEPFDECGGTTHILRLSWSPDGQYLVSAHAMNGGGPTAVIIEREGWKCDKDFVGHRKAVTCVRFHNSILKRLAPKTQKAQQYCCLAVGSRDRTVSVWMTALQRPLIVVRDLFQDSVLDLSWGPDNYVLLACSGDGTVACLQFSDKEIGKPLSEHDKNALYQRVYGKSATADVHSSPGRDMVIENAELLDVMQEKPKPPSFPTISCNLSSAEPLTISVNDEFMEVDKPAPITPHKAINKQIETITADGKKRITPIFIPLHQEVSNTNTPFSRVTNGTEKAEPQNTIQMKSTISNAVTNKVLEERKTITDAAQAHLDNRLTKVMLPAPIRSTGIIKTTQAVNQLLPGQKMETKSGPAKINLTAAGKSEGIKIAGNYRVHVQNGNLSLKMGTLSKVSCTLTTTNEKLWETYVGSPIVNFSPCLKYVLLCSADGTVRFINIQSGTSALPILSLTTTAIQCAFCPLGILGGVISESGELRVWNVNEKSVYIASSCSEIFKTGKVIQFYITENGLPFILFSNGNSYSYSKDMQCWMVLSSKDPIIRHGMQATIPKEFQKNLRYYPLMSVQTAFQSSHQNFVEVNPASWHNMAELSFIENQIKLCEAINSVEELKYWYSRLGYHLANHGTEKRLRLLLDDLLGPIHRARSKAVENILTVDKLTLLDTILNTLKAHPKWQRVYMEYREQLDSIKKSNITT